MEKTKRQGRDRILLVRILSKKKDGKTMPRPIKTIQARHPGLRHGAAGVVETLTKKGVLK